jgi:succinate dehydrogenase / fumarate reductase cytochrome b subunit
MNEHSAFFWKRLHSLTGVIPIGLFLLLHFYSASFAVKGAMAFDHRLATLRKMPWILPIEIMCIYLPLLFHGILGIILSIKVRYNFPRYGYFNNLRYLLQRISGVGVFFFVGAHVYKTKIEPLINGYTLGYEHMSRHMHQPLTLAVYLLGIIGAAYHLSNGLATFSFTWGITISEKSQSRMAAIALALFCVVAFIGINSILGFLGLGLNI